MLDAKRWTYFYYSILFVYCLRKRFLERYLKTDTKLVITEWSNRLKQFLPDQLWVEGYEFVYIFIYNLTLHTLLHITLLVACISCRINARRCIFSILCVFNILTSNVRTHIHVTCSVRDAWQ